MPRTLATIAITAGIAAAVTAAVILLPGIGDPTEAVPAVSIGDVAPAPALESSAPGGSTRPSAPGGSTRPSAPGGSIRPVTALEELTGTVQRTGDDADDYGVGRVDLDFGPEGWVVAAEAAEDYDGDGTAEQLDAELEGLLGQDVRLLVRFDDDRDDADVYTIADLPYRDVSGGPAPWELAQSEATPAAAAIGREEAGELAAAAVGDGARPTDIDAGDDFPVAWEVEVLAADGTEHEVLLDASGEVLDQRLDS